MESTLLQQPEQQSDDAVSTPQPRRTLKLVLTLQPRDDVHHDADLGQHGAAQQCRQVLRRRGELPQQQPHAPGAVRIGGVVHQQADDLAQLPLGRGGSRVDGLEVIQCHQLSVRGDQHRLVQAGPAAEVVVHGRQVRASRAADGAAGSGRESVLRAQPSRRLDDAEAGGVTVGAGPAAGSAGGLHSSNGHWN